MKEEAVGKVLTMRRRARSSGPGLVAGIREKWSNMAGTVSSWPRILFGVAAFAATLWVIFDFVSFSLGTLPVSSGAIEVIGTRRLTEETVRTEIYRKLRTADADNLLEVDVTEMSEYLVQRIPALRSAVVTKDVGRGILTIVVAERTGIATIRARVGKFEVDKEGMLFQVGGNSAADLPEVTGLAGSSIASGRNLFEHPSGAGLLRLLMALPQGFSPKLKFVRVIRPEYFELTFSGGTLVKADPMTFPAKANNLQRILRKLESRPSAKPQAARAARPVQYIDIRFQQDVVAYSKEEPSSAPAPSARPTRGISQGR